jgi:small conductance mechanosensitive channel
MRHLTDLVDRAVPTDAPIGRVVVIVGLFLAAWLVKRVAGRVAAWLVDRSERGRTERADTGVILSLRQRETAIRLIQTSVSYLAFALALVLSIATLLGARRVETVVGAGFLAVVFAFAAQRFLMDVIAGLLTFFEGWFRVGDTVEIVPWALQGVVERVSVRSVTVRSVDGQVIHVPNSAIQALKVSPHGIREIELEFFATDLDAGVELVERAARIVPVGPTEFVRRPAVVATDALDEGLVRIRARAAVAPGRDWLAEDFLPNLMTERAQEGLVLHGPVVIPVDEQAAQRFARSVWTSRSGRAARDRA